jgi:hypothetical protein
MTQSLRVYLAVLALLVAGSWASQRLGFPWVGKELQQSFY